MADIIPINMIIIIKLFLASSTIDAHPLCGFCVVLIHPDVDEYLHTYQLACTNSNGANTNKIDNNKAH